MNFEKMAVLLLVAFMFLSTLPIMNLREADGADGSFGGGSGTIGDPFVIEDISDLQAMNENLSAHYILENNIDASVTETWNDGAGFIPIGERYHEYGNMGRDPIENPFTGSLDGNDHRISGLYINRPANESVALIGFAGPVALIKDVIMIDADITGNVSVGCLVGYSEGTISNCQVSGTINGSIYVGGMTGVNNEGSISGCVSDIEINGSPEWLPDQIVYVGGLVGHNKGTIVLSKSTGTVEGDSSIGGLVGQNEGGSISNSSTDADVSGNEVIAGLIGINKGNVHNCSSSGNVISEGESIAGGLVGFNNEGSLSHCIADGDVVGMDNVGGLVGFNSASIDNCHSEGNVEGESIVGGLVGSNMGSVTTCYSTSMVLGTVEMAGGLTGYNVGDISICYSTGDVSGPDMNAGGLIGTNLGDVSNCFSTGSVASSDSTAGGLLGIHINGDVIYCYSTGGVSGPGEHIGGLVGFADPESEESSMEYCYWDTDTSGWDVSGDGEGRTTVDMMSRATYEFWDFARIWGISEGASYPFLRVFMPSASILSPRSSGTLVRGDGLRFLGSSVLDQAIGYRWDLGDGRTASIPDPGLVSFPSIVTEEVTYTFRMNGEDHGESDSRTFEVVDDTFQYPDLEVSNIELPELLTVGEKVSVHYTIINVGDDPVSGQTWRDSFYLSRDPCLDVTDIPLSSSTSSAVIPVDGSYLGTMEISIPPVTDGLYYIILSANDDWAFTERHRLNNEKEEYVDISIIELEEGIERNAQYPPDPFEHFYRLTMPSGTGLHLTLEGEDGMALMVKHGDLPSRTFYDHSSKSGDLVIPSTYSGTWYVLVRGDGTQGHGTYSIIYETVNIFLSRAAPTRHVKEMPLDLILSGVGFKGPLDVELAGSDGNDLLSGSVEVHSTTHLTAHFSGAGLQADVYDIRIMSSGSSIAQLDNGLEVLSKGEPDFGSRIILPRSMRYKNAPATLYLEYENKGDVSMPAPLLIITGYQEGSIGALLTQYAFYLKNGVWSTSMPSGFGNRILYLASGDYPGVLHPGESKRVPIYYAGWQEPVNMDLPPMDWHIEVADDNDVNEIEWTSLKYEIKPDEYSEEAWDLLWSGFIDLAGETYADFIDLLRTNAARLFWEGQQIDDVDQLMGLTIRRAEGFCLIPSLYSHQDMALPCPGTDLTLERYHVNHITKRFNLGPLGYGWAHNWEYELEEKDDGTIEIRDMSGTPRIFHEDARDDKVYLSQPGDTGRLETLPSGGFSLTEAARDILMFDPDGALEYSEDSNGNRITLEYNSGSLVKLTHSSGGYLALSYDNGGQVISVMDGHGRETTYSYSDGHLTTVQAYDGYIETFGYDTSEGSPSEHGLTSISLPTESDVTIEYDELGRLSSIFRGTRREEVTFSYGYNSVVATDASGNKNTYRFDHAGRITGHKNPLGEVYRNIYDDRGRLTEVIDPEGLSVQMEHNENDDLVRFTDRSGMISRFGYSDNPGLATQFSDPSWKTIAYDRDEQGNVEKVHYPDGTNEIWSFDTAGNPVTWKNRRGNVTTYSYDDLGKMTGKIYSNMSEIIYEYDDLGYLTSMEDGSGITGFTRDDHGYVERIDYPGGRWLEFTYDDARRRSSYVDQLGNHLNYQYDDAGRLEVLSDGSDNDIVSYEYDSTGRISGKTLENGVYTTYEYDEMWRIENLVNHAPDDSVLSSFFYSYDSLGRVVEMETHYGTCNYVYDDSGQLTEVVMDSTVPEIPSQNLSYIYDRSGNRIRTVINGVDEHYQSNICNQYIRVVDHNLTYDADGNLIMDESPEGNITYAYDDENRLIGVFREGDEWEYVYDGLGNRVVTMENANTSYHVFDPASIGNLVGTYNGSGPLTSGYLHGSGLIGQFNASGDRYYHTFDALGSVHHLTDEMGDAVNSYAYLPFGDSLLSEEAVTNPFGFIGEDGVMSDPSGLIHMRARSYTPHLGRFITNDPIGITGGDLNTYRYVRNSPTNGKDPEGLQIPWNQVLNPGNFIPGTDIGDFLGGDAGGAIGAGFDISGGFSCVTLGLGIALAPAAGVAALAVGIGLAAWGLYNIIGGVSTILDFIGSCLAALGLDPNHKESSIGFGPDNHIAEGSLISYRVDFENLGEATGPAQIVTIRDPLSEDLDWSTFEFTQIGFGDIMIPLDEGTRYMDRIVEYRYRDDEYDMEFEVHIDAVFNMETGEIRVNFYSIDPETGLPPEGNIGFLPPEDKSGRGKGFFEYLIRPDPDLPTGTEIRNIATIQFDFGLSIDTNQIDPMDKSKGTDPDLEALVTIDAGLPESRVMEIPATANPSFTVSWSGDDDDGGSGIGVFDVYVSVDDGPWMIWMEGTNATSAVYEGDMDGTYRFYCIATDNVGHREIKGPIAEASVTVSEATMPTADAGPDQTVQMGSVVTFDGSASSDDLGIVNYTWTFNDGISDISLQGVGPNHSFVISGIFTITLNVTNSAGFWDTDTMELKVEMLVDDDDTDDDDAVDDDTTADDDAGDKGKGGTFLYILLSIILILLAAAITAFLLFWRNRSSKEGIEEE